MAKQMRVQELAARLKAGEPVYLLDVRKPWEHELASLPASRLIPLDELPARAGEIDCPEGTPVVVYCHHGIRSLSAANFLEALGRGAVFSLAGGIDAWSLQIDLNVPRY